MTFASGLERLVSEHIQADDRSEYTVSNTRCFVSKTDTCTSDEAFHEVPLGTSVQRCCRKFGSFVMFQAASLELSGCKGCVFCDDGGSCNSESGKLLASAQERE